MTYGDSLTYPTNDEDWIRTVVIGGVLMVFGFLLLPALVVYGYLVRVIRASVVGDAEPPAFGDWGELLVDGLKVWVISVVYMIVPIVVAAVTVGGSVLAFLTGTDAGAALGIAGLLGGLALSGLLALAFGYVAVVAVVNFASEGAFGAAFDFGTIVDVATDARYAVAWLVSVVVFLAVGFVSGVLGFVPILGAVLSAFVVFYASVVAANLWGEGFAAATADRAEEPSVEEPGDVAV